MKKIAYFSRDGLLEPLGQSQVLSYLRNLSKFYDITLVTFEKKNDLKDFSKLSNQKLECEELSIKWRIFKFKYGPKYIRHVIDIFKFTYIGFRLKFKGVQLIHCRSYIPAISALILKKLCKIDFIFDMRALWPDELVSAKSIKENSFAHKLLIFLEGLLIKNAGKVVSLTTKAKGYLVSKLDHKDLEKKISVIPTCVDLDKFNFDNSHFHFKEEFVVMSFGSFLNGWFLIDRLIDFFCYVSNQKLDAKFRLITRDDKKILEDLFLRANFDISRLEILSASPNEIYKNISDSAICVMFYANVKGKWGSCPTRFGESLASGIPIIANNGGIGDTANYIQESEAGYLLDSFSETSFSKGFNHMQKLFNSESSFKFCKEIAYKEFSLPLANDRYLKIYQELIS